MELRPLPMLLSMTFLAALPVHALERRPLSGHVPAAVTRVKPAGRMAPTDQLDLAIGLPLRDQTRLNALLHELYDPTSAHYHKYLSAEEFTAAFGPKEEDYQAAIDFATRHGLKVTHTHSNRMLLNVRGSVSNVEKALQLTLRLYSHPEEARQFFAPDSEPVLDLGAPVLHISGLNNYRLPASRIVRADTGASARPRLGSGPDGSWFGKDFRRIYVPGTTLTGAGQAVGLFELDGYYPGDVAAYLEQAGLPEVELQTVLIDGFDGKPTTRANVEVALDIEMVISMAPGLSKVLVYEGDRHATLSTINLVLNRMATDNLANQLSCSWGFDIDVTTQQIFQQYAAQGQSFFLASGDVGAAVGPVVQPADNPYITVVGGTELAVDLSGAWSSESAWRGGGGGISTLYPIPEWQTGINMSLNGGSTAMRNYPDVAMVANNVWVIADNGHPDSVSGTSIAAPLWAAFTALINEQAVAQGQPPVGFLNPALYALGKGANANSAFHDIVVGRNTTSSSPFQFFATAGYDLCTGWGTPAGTNFIDALLAIPSPKLLITPPLGFVAFGPAGGPFNVSSQMYNLTNSGTAPLDWTVDQTGAWLDVFPQAGTLLSGGPSTWVTVTLNPMATAYLLGEFSAGIRFTDLSTGVEQKREFRLLVGNGGFETADFTNWTVAAQEEVNFVDSFDRDAFQGGRPTMPGVKDEQFVHSGIYGAFLGQNTSPGSISQTLPTSSGQEYTLSFWLDNPAVGTPNLFQVSWNGHRLFDQRDLPSFSWTNLQYMVTAAATNSLLEFRFQNDLNAFGLDDITLAPRQPTATLALWAAPSEGGTVSGSGTFPVGSQQQISATAAPGWTFAGWSDGDLENPRTVTVPSNGTSITANFSAMAELRVMANPLEGGLVNGMGSFRIGSQQQIAAAALPGWTFTGWNDGNTEAARIVTVPANGVTYTATFAQLAELRVLVNPPEGGLVNGMGSYPVGTQQQISAVAMPGWTFAEWSDGNQEIPRTVTVPADGATFTASFIQVAELKVVANPVEGGAVNGSGTHPVGSQRVISATVTNGWIFAGWSDGNFDNPRTVTVPADGATFTASFIQVAELKVVANPVEGGAVNGSGTHPVGSQRVISATVTNGWIFAGWSDGNFDNPRTVTVPADGATFTASFIQVAPAGLSLAFSETAFVLSLTVTGTTGAEYVLQRSSDLAAWTEFQIVRMNSGGTAQLAIGIEAAPTTFWRVVPRN